MHCTRNTLLPYEYEWACFSCGYKVIKNEIRKIERKKNFGSRSKNEEKKIICVRIYVHKK